MDFGIPTLVELESLDATIDLCMDLGLDFIELNMNMPQYQLDFLTAKALRNYLDGSVYFTVHLDESLNVWDFNPLVSKAYLDTVLQTIALAKEINIPILNMHMNRGVHFTLPNRRIFLFDRYIDTYIEKTKVFRDECEKSIGQSGIKICIENCNGYTSFQQKAIDCLLESKVFGLTFDIGHNHSAGMRDEDFIYQRSDRLCHMHIHDAISTKNHLALGEGEVDVHEKLLFAKSHNCRCVFETKTINGIKNSVNNLRHSPGLNWL